MNEIEIGEATVVEREWCARLMAASEPWTTLGRGYDVLLPAVLDPACVVLVARLSGEPRGFARIHPHGVAGSPYLASIAVAEEERGRGIGSALLDAMEARYAGARYLFLCVSSFNARARELYERRGYRLVGVLPDYIVDGASELLMARKLV